MIENSVDNLDSDGSIEAEAGYTGFKRGMEWFQGNKRKRFESELKKKKTSFRNVFDQSKFYFTLSIICWHMDKQCLVFTIQ